MDTSKRKQRIEQLQEYLVEQMPWVPTVTRAYYRFMSCHTKNMRSTHNTLETWGLEHTWLDSSGC